MVGQVGRATSEQVCPGDSGAPAIPTLHITEEPGGENNRWASDGREVERGELNLRPTEPTHGTKLSLLMLATF